MGTRGERGQTLVIVALGMIAFFGFLGLSLDGASAYLAQQTLQQDADLAAITSTWAYYHATFQETDTYGTVAGGQSAAQAAVTASLSANHYSGNPVTVTYINASGTDAGATPQPWEIRGVQVRLSKVLPTQILQSVGIGNPTVVAVARAQFGPNTGAQNEAPLLVQNWNPAQVLPRVTPYGAGGCSGSQGDGVRYPMSTDCRPSTGGGWTAGQLLSLEPAWGGGAHPELGAWATAPKSTFFLLHEPATSQLASDTPSQGVVTTGLPEFLPTCAPGCAGATQVFADTTSPATDPVVGGINARITAAAAGGSKWAAQSCAQPHDPTNPLTPDNPRLMRLPVTYNTASGSGTPPGFYVSETLMFCADSVPQGGGSYAISGYLEEMPTNQPTVLRAGDTYFGRDVVVKLLS